MAARRPTDVLDRVLEAPVVPRDGDSEPLVAGRGFAVTSKENRPPSARMRVPPSTSSTVTRTCPIRSVATLPSRLPGSRAQREPGAKRVRPKLRLASRSWTKISPRHR